MTRMTEKHRLRGSRRYAVVLADATRNRSRFPTCVYCGTRVVTTQGARVPNGMTMDHVRPRSTARDERELKELLGSGNIVTACFACNERKANYSPEDYFSRGELLEVLRHMRERIMPPAHVGRLVDLAQDKDSVLEKICAWVLAGASWDEVVARLKQESESCA